MAGSANWKCADCDNNNGPKDTACGICGSTRRAPMPRPAAPSRPTPKRPTPARPAGDWQCTRCRATNPARRSTCAGCGKDWKETGGPAPKKTSPRPATPKATPPRTTTPRTTTPKATPPRTSPAKKATPRKTTPPRTGTPGSRPTGVFYPPPSSTGYTPTPPRATTPSSYTPPSYTPPRYTPPTYTPPPYRAPVKKKSNGCMISCLGVVGGLVLLGIAQSVFIGALDSDDPTDSKPTSSPSSTGAACPSRIASALPSGKGASLVEAFHTKDHQITLCRTKAGKLYYYGEFRDQREAGIAMPAKKTSDGYEANNSPYRYVISGGTVTIYKSGSRLDREELTPEPSPS
ncbi:zinc finger Ran-binding domain-containing protein [Streptomyces sp. NPDC059352]|uniref:zinc finger Ran-binding domain-containing protein n=1 Tax=Streptomyces sp. NPDC059352 TaxID=3346810 RepID=UPI00368BA6FB